MFTVSSFNIKKPAFLTETLPQLKDQLKSTFSQPILASLHSIKRKTQQCQDEQQSIFLQVGSKVWEGVPKNMRTELWLSVLQRKDAGLGSEAAARYEEMLATELKQKTATDIDKDVPRTFPNTKKFHSQEGQNALRRVLRAYAAYDPEVGYCQGMNFLAGLLLLYLSEEHAFGALVLIMFERGFRLLYQCNMSLLQVQLWQLSQLMPSKLRTHMESCGVVPVLFAAPWLMTCYSADFPISFSSRVLDTVFSNNMVSPLLRVAVVLLKRCEKKLRTLPDMEDILMFLKLEVPGWEESELHAILTDAFNKDWHDRHKAVLGSTEGMETIAQAMARVHVVPGEQGQEEAQVIGTMVSASATTDSESAHADNGHASTESPSELPVLHVRLPSGVPGVSKQGSADGRPLIDTEADGNAATPGSAASSCFSFSDIESMSQSGRSQEQSDNSPSAAHSPHSDFWDPYLHDLRLFTMGEIIELRNLSFNKTPRYTDHSGRGFGKGLVRSRSATAHCSLDGLAASSDDDDETAFFEVPSRSGSITSLRSLHPNRSQSIMVEVGFPMSPSSTSSSSRARFNRSRTGERSNLRAAAAAADAADLEETLVMDGHEGRLPLQCIHGSLLAQDDADYKGCSPRSVDSAPAAVSNRSRTLLSKPSFSCMSESEVMASRAFPSAASFAMCMAAGSAVAEAIALSRAANASICSSVVDSDASMHTGRQDSMVSVQSRSASQVFYECNDLANSGLVLLKANDSVTDQLQMQASSNYPQSPQSAAESASGLSSSLSTALSASPSTLSSVLSARHGSLHIALSATGSGIPDNSIPGMPAGLPQQLVSMPSRLSRVNEWTEAAFNSLAGAVADTDPPSTNQHHSPQTDDTPTVLGDDVQPGGSGAQHAQAGNGDEPCCLEDSILPDDTPAHKEESAVEYTREPLQAALRAAHGSHLFPDVSRAIPIPAAPVQPSCSPSTGSQVSNIASSQLDGNIMDMDGWLQHFPANSTAVADASAASVTSDTTRNESFAQQGMQSLSVASDTSTPVVNEPGSAVAETMLTGPSREHSTAAVLPNVITQEPGKPSAPVTDFSDIDVGLPVPSAPIPMRAMASSSSAASSPTAAATKLSVNSISAQLLNDEAAACGSAGENAWQAQQLTRSTSQAQPGFRISSTALNECEASSPGSPPSTTFVPSHLVFGNSPATPPMTPSRLSQSQLQSDPTYLHSFSSTANALSYSGGLEVAFTPVSPHTTVAASTLSRQISSSPMTPTRMSLTTIGAMPMPSSSPEPVSGPSSSSIPAVDPWMCGGSGTNTLRSSMSKREPLQQEVTPSHSAVLSKTSSRLGTPALLHSPSHRLSSSAIWDATTTTLDSQASISLGGCDDEPDGFARLASERLSFLSTKTPAGLEPKILAHSASQVTRTQGNSMIGTPASPCSPRHSSSCIPDIPSITALAQATFARSDSYSSPGSGTLSPSLPKPAGIPPTTRPIPMNDASQSASPAQSGTPLRQNSPTATQLNAQVARSYSRRNSLDYKPAVSPRNSMDPSSSAAFQSLVTAALLNASDAPAPASPRTSGVATGPSSVLATSVIRSNSSTPPVPSSLSFKPLPNLDHFTSLAHAPSADTHTTPSNPSTNVPFWDAAKSTPNTVLTSPSPLEQLNTDRCASGTQLTSHALQGSIHSTISSKQDSTPSSATKSVATPFMTEQCTAEDHSPIAREPCTTDAAANLSFATPADAGVSCRTPDVCDTALHGPLSDTTLSPAASPGQSPLLENTSCLHDEPAVPISHKKPFNHVLHVSVSTSPVQDTIFSMSPGHITDSPEPAASGSLDLLDSLPSVPYIQPSDGIPGTSQPPPGLWYNTPPVLETPGSPNIASSFQSVDSFILVSPPAYASMRSANGRPPSPGRDRVATRGAAMFAALHAHHRPKKSLDSQILDQLNGFQANCAPATQPVSEAVANTSSGNVALAQGQQWRLQQSNSFSQVDKVDVLNERLSAYLSDVTEVL